jgi:aminoglycoside phosphotransferase (APT) family kinase protein
MAEWDAEVVVSAADVGAIVGAQYPEFRDRRVVPYAEGWDNAGFLVDDAVLFRFPRRAIAVDLLTREIALLPRIAPLLPLPISAPQYHGIWRGEARWPFAGYRILAGEPVSLRDLDDDARIRIAVPLANFLRDLHALDAKPLIDSGLPDDLFGRFDAGKLLPRVAARVATARAAGYDVPSGVLRWFDDHPPRLDERRTLVHGDLYARHLLLDADGSACGVIDWGDMHVGMPAIDLAAAHTMLPPEAHAAFLAAYGPVDDAVWSAARWRGVYSAMVALEYGITAGAEDMRRCGAAALRLIARAVGDARDDQAGK